MGATSISAFYRLARSGQTIYLLGSGKTLDYIPAYFFKDKIVIGVNATHRDFPVTYAFAHHREDAADAIAAGQITIVSEYDQGRRENGLNTFDGDWWYYKHPQQPSTLVMDMTPFEQDLKDTLIIGSNTVTSAMDFAGRILGAAAIVLCGVDSGSLDGCWNYEKYNGGCTEPRYDGGELHGTLNGTGLHHIRAQRSLIMTVTEALRKRGVTVCSLNPFVDFGLEGHVFAR